MGKNTGLHHLFFKSMLNINFTHSFYISFYYHSVAMVSDKWANQNLEPYHYGKHLQISVLILLPAADATIAASK